jgi:hypothetical protein
VRLIKHELEPQLALVGLQAKHEGASSPTGRSTVFTTRHTGDGLRVALSSAPLEDGGTSSHRIGGTAPR